MDSLALFYDNLSNPHRVMPGRSYPERIAPFGKTLQPVTAGRIRLGAKDRAAHRMEFWRPPVRPLVSRLGQNATCPLILQP